MPTPVPRSAMQRSVVRRAAFDVMTWLRRLQPGRAGLRRWRARLTTPMTQVLTALVGMIGGAAILGRVALGLTILFACLALAADGMFRNAGPTDAQLRNLTSHEEIIERWRRAK